MQITYGIKEKVIWSHYFYHFTTRKNTFYTVQKQLLVALLGVTSLLPEMRNHNFKNRVLSHQRSGVTAKS